MIKNYNKYIKESVIRKSLQEPTDEEIKEAEEYLKKGIDWDIISRGCFIIDVSGKYSVYYTLWREAPLNTHFITNLSTDFQTAVEKAKKAAGRIPVIIDRTGTKAGLFQAAKSEILSFGKHRGETLGDIFVSDPQYLTWLYKSDKPLGKETREKLKYYNDLYFETLTKKNLEESTSEFIGKIGEKITIDADVYNYEVKSNPFDNKIQHSCKLIDENGNKYMTYNLGRQVKKGDSVKLTAKVKDHKELLGIKFTVLYYCKVLQVSNLEDNINKYNI